MDRIKIIFDEEFENFDEGDLKNPEFKGLQILAKHSDNVEVNVGHDELFMGIKEEEYELNNCFKIVKNRRVDPDIKTITLAEYSALLEISQKPELGKQLLSTGEVKNHYKPWLRDGFELGLETGRRREEIVKLKFCDIKKNEEGMEYIKVEDYKVNRQKNQEGDEKKYNPIPMTKSLHSLLLSMNYDRFKHTDKYILAPNEKMKRETMLQVLTKGFSHYYRQLKTGRELSFKSLRKTYISNLCAFMGVDNARLVTGHSTTQVMGDHYINKTIIGHTVRNFENFADEKPDEKKRADDLKKTRTKQTEKEITLER